MTIRIKILWFSFIYVFKINAKVDTLTAANCFNDVYKTRVGTNAVDGVPIDLVAACSSDGSMPFTLCQQKLWVNAELEFYKLIEPGNRMFIGFSDALQTYDYHFMADGGFVFNETISYFVAGPGSADTRKSCVAIQFPAEKTWRTLTCGGDPSVAKFSACEAKACNSSWKSVSLPKRSKKLCYKTDAVRSFDQATTDCNSIRGKLLQLSTFQDSNDVVTQMAKNIVSAISGIRGINLWMDNGTCRSWGNGLYMERVACDFKQGDKYMCMNTNPKSTYAGSYKGCSALPQINKGPVVSTDMMQVRYCISICQGQRKAYAGLHNFDCFCLDLKIPTSEICNVSCPGNPNQPCGGPNAISLFDSSNYFGAAADNCTAYYEMGFHPPAGQPVTFKTKSSEMINCSLETLIPPSVNFRPCPTGWVMINQTCLYFGHNETTSDDAHRICQSMQGDLAYLDDPGLRFVRMTVKRPRSFSRHDAWHFGAYNLGTNQWTWRDGRPMRNYDTLSVTNENTRGISVSILNYILRYNYTINDSTSIVDATKIAAFICSLNEQFLGQQSPILDTGMLAKHQSSTNMSVTACIQLCLLNSSRQIAQVFGDTCVCSQDNVVSTTVMTFECHSPTICPGHPGQICGCDGKASFYYVDPLLTPKYYNCIELEAHGVGINGVYVTLAPFANNGNEQTTLCIFPDGSNMCPKELSYQYRNKCYSVVGELRMHHDAAKYCMDRGYNLAIPNDEDEERFLVMLMITINGPQSQGWLGTVNHEGTLYNITLGQDMLSNEDTGDDQCLYLFQAEQNSVKTFGSCLDKKAFICQSTTCIAYHSHQLICSNS